MPNRIIKESICTSEDIARLSRDAEILFYRLIVNADDYGRYFGNPSIVKGNCFPLRSDAIASEQVNAWLDELHDAGLLIRYEAEGRQYIQFCKWDKHQTIRARKSKFPSPASNCKQMQADASKCPRNPIQSNPIRIQSESNPNDDDEDDFDTFWDAYPKKSGDIRQAYFEYLGAIQSGATEAEILEAVKRQSEVKDARYFPSAEKWLRNKGWTEQTDTGAPKQHQKRVTTFMDIGEAERERRASND